MQTFSDPGRNHSEDAGDVLVLVKRPEGDRIEMEKKFKEILAKFELRRRIQEMVYARVRNRESNRKAEEVAAEAERKQAVIKKKACMHDALI